MLSSIATHLQLSSIAEFFGPELKLENFLPETFGKPLFQYRFRRISA